MSNRILQCIVQQPQRLFAAAVTPATPGADKVHEVAGIAVKETTSFIVELLGPWSAITVAGIELWRYLGFLAMLLVVLVVYKVAKFILGQFLKRIRSREDKNADGKIIEFAVQPAGLTILAVGGYLASMMMLEGVAPAWEPLLAGRICKGLILGAFFWYLYRLVSIADQRMRTFACRADNDLDNTVVDVLRKILRLFIVGIAIAVICRNVLEWDITAILASAGVAGLALAFAAQDTIASFFGTLMILLDRPFKLGEPIKLGAVTGVVESVGFRSTRIRTADGNLVSIPNKEVANATVENIGRRPSIHRTMMISLALDTPVAKIDRALEIIRSLLANHECMKPDLPPRVYFAEIAASSLNIQVEAWYHSSDYWKYVQWSENLGLEILRRLAAEGIKLAVPARMAYLTQPDGQPLQIQIAPVAPKD